MYAASRMASTVLALLATTFVQDAMAAVVATPRLERRASPTDVWVSVDGNGKPSTVTPVMTTISGQPTVVSGAPNELTGTVFTITSVGVVQTSTGTTPLVTATAANGSGAFARCFNKDGEFAPVCTPNKNASMFVGTQYYVTWDPDFFNQGNMTSDLTNVMVSAFMLNSTTNAPIGDRVDLTQQPVRGSLGFWTWKVDDSALAGQDQTNVTLLLLYGNTVGSGLVRNATGPTVLVQKVPQFHPPPTKAPVGPALYIGLPTVLGVVVLALFGTCLWNRRSRQIGLGNIMSRSRHGYGIGESRAKRMAKSVRRSVMLGAGRRGKDAGIQLDARGVPEQEYRDVPEERPGRGRGIAREEGYTDDSFQNQAVGGGRNVFREEVRRQDKDMF